MVVKRIGEHGGYTVLPVTNALAPISEMSAHSWLAVESVFGLYGANFFGITSPGLDVGHRVPAPGRPGPGRRRASWMVLRRFFRCEDRIAQVLALGILINVAAYLLSTVPTTYWSARELAGVLPAAPCWRAGCSAAASWPFRLVPAMAVVLACYLAALGYTVAQPSRPAITQDLADWLVAHHLTYGLSSYGIANATTLASGGAVSIRSVSFYNNDAAPGPYEFDQTWYDPRLHDATFVVLMKPPVPLDEIATWEVRDAFGRPTHVYDFGPYVIMTYDTNLLTDLSPSLPSATPARQLPAPFPTQPDAQPLDPEVAASGQAEQLGGGVSAGPRRAVGGQVSDALRRGPERQAHLHQDQIGPRREQAADQRPGLLIPVRVAYRHH